MSQPIEFEIYPQGDEALDVWSKPGTRNFLQGINDVRAIDLFTASGTVSGLNANELSLWFDYSHWNGEVDLTAALPYVHGIFTKACDGHQIYKGSSTDLENYKDRTFNTNVQKAYDAHIPCIPYHYWQWDYPDLNLDHTWKFQFDVIKNALKGLVPGKSFHAIAIDIEERGDSGVNAKNRVEGLYALLVKEYPNIPIIFYTSIGVLDGYPALTDWLAPKELDRQKTMWMAQWVFNSADTVTFPELYAEYISKMKMKVSTPGWLAQWTWVQWAACFKVPGCKTLITDLNFFHGTKEQAYAFLNYKSTTTPPPPPDDDEEEEEDVDTSNFATKESVQALEARLLEAETKITQLINWKNVVL